MSEISIDTSVNETRLNQFTFKEVPSLGLYVTPSEAKKRPIYNWFLYPHSYSPSLVWYLMDQFQVTEQKRILDPFVGAGTTLLAAKERGVSATGIDLLPISSGLVRAKVAQFSKFQLKKTINKINKAILSSDFRRNGHIPANISKMQSAPNSILARAFQPETLEAIARIKSIIEIEAVHPDEYYFALVALLYVLEGHSSTLKSGGWLKITESPKNRGSVENSFLSRIHQMYDELIKYQVKQKSGCWDIIIGDSRTVHENLGLFDAIITSPPYLNRHDYTRVLCLELLIGFLDAYDDITSLRHNLLRSHVEAKPIPSPANYKHPLILNNILDELKARKAEKRVLYIVAGYFEDMYLTLCACSQYLAQGGHVAFVVGNVRFSGLPIPVDEILAEIGQSIGLSCRSILVARRRNNSAQQMRDFGRDPSRESIVIWQKNQ